jgi:16S rRNA (adenine1518-N6/adenine1519-N6)-dimethyltransferase
LSGDNASALEAFVDIPWHLAYIDGNLTSMLAPKKSLGQNFLRDENIARKIIESLGLTPDEIVLEIGSGQGDLTKLLLPAAKQVIGIEIDPRALQILRERFGPTLHLIEQDVLTLQLDSLTKNYGAKPCVVGNIPYYITSEILFWLYDQRSFIRHATLMMQEEVAERLVARSGTKEYGILTIFTQFYASPRLLFKVSRNSFHPRPNVDSAVVRFEFPEEVIDVDQKMFRNVVRTTFGTRRKMIRNVLRTMGFTEEQLSSVKFDLSKRPEDLTLDDFIYVTRLLTPFSSTPSLKF